MFLLAEGFVKGRNGNGVNTDSFGAFCPSFIHLVPCYQRS